MRAQRNAAILGLSLTLLVPATALAWDFTRVPVHGMSERPVVTPRPWWQQVLHQRPVEQCPVEQRPVEQKPAPRPAPPRRSARVISWGNCVPGWKASLKGFIAPRIQIQRRSRPISLGQDQTAPPKPGSCTAQLEQRSPLELTGWAADQARPNPLIGLRPALRQAMVYETIHEGGNATEVQVDGAVLPVHAPLRVQETATAGSPEQGRSGKGERAGGMVVLTNARGLERQKTRYEWRRKIARYATQRDVDFYPDVHEVGQPIYQGGSGSALYQVRIEKGGEFQEHYQPWVAGENLRVSAPYTGKGGERVVKLLGLAALPLGTQVRITSLDQPRQSVSPKVKRRSGSLMAELPALDPKGRYQLEVSYPKEDGRAHRVATTLTFRLPERAHGPAPRSLADFAAVILE